MLAKQVFNANDRTKKKVEKSYQYCPLCGTPLTRETSKDQRARCLQCGWVHYQNPSPGVVTVITEGDRVLLGKRVLGSFAARKWCLPSDKSDRPPLLPRVVSAA